MITVELTMGEAHALSDMMMELLGPEVTPVPIDWEAVRTADKKITNTVKTEELLLQEMELEAA